MTVATIRELHEQFPMVRKLFEREGEALVIDHGTPRYQLMTYPEPATAKPVAVNPERSIPMQRSLLIVLTFALFPLAAHAMHVSEFGAKPDDGRCDTEVLNAALVAAKQNGARELNFAAGTYNLTKPIAKDHYLALVEIKNLALVGAVDARGEPLTRLERNIKLNNDTQAPIQLSVLRSTGITVRNFILTNNPPFGTRARVIAVDAAKDKVVVEVLPDLPAYDGMRCASAHAWDLTTGKLKRFGTTPAEATLTIGLGIKAFWQAVPGTNARQLSMTGAGFSK
jgi:hypothetical protein